VIPPEPENPAVLSVADILRREGLRGPHTTAQQLRPRGHVGPPVPTLSAPRPPGHGRAAVAVGALALAGAVLGAAALQEAQADRADAGGTDGAAGAAGERVPGVAAPTAPAGAPSDLVALATAFPTPAPAGDPTPVTGADIAALATGGAPAPRAPGALPAPGAPAGGAAGPGGTAGAPGGGAPGGDGGSGAGPGGDGSGGDGGSGDGDGGGDSGGGDGGGGADGGTVVEPPGVRAPALPAAPAVRPGAVALEPDGVAVTGPSASTEPVQLGPAGVGAARLAAPEAELTASDGAGVRLSEAEVETPDLDVAGAELDVPDLATPPAELGLPLG
jgi:hypothetical protein